MVRLVSAVDPPTAALNNVAPVELTASVLAPSTGLPKLTAEPESVVLLPIVTLPVYACVPPVVIVAVLIVIPVPPVRLRLPVVELTAAPILSCPSVASSVTSPDP